jgi:hypothetical protein
VRELGVGSFARALNALRPQLVDVPFHEARLTTTVCVVAYLGHFDSARVERGWQADARTGKFALVVVRETDDRVLATLVLAKVPLQFSHLYLLDR